ncbi:MAG: hypothetical protein MUC42_17800, partial [Bryobacter sp.]|nr:hypothetical protein [Bryobacter sp.]
PVWNMYWLNLWGLHFGLDILQHATHVLQDRAHEEGFRFYSRYGGEKDPATSPGAWCALHDGRDAADFERFPADRFGSGTLRSPAGVARTVRIAEAFASRGALQGDPEKGSLLVMQNRDAAHMNDVGWNIEAGNYQRYLRQIDPNGTSLGWWRAGPKDQPYGRFARGFHPAAGRNTMFFDLDDRFFSQLRGPVVLRVIYFDSGSGAWELRYDNNRLALQVRNGNSGRWKEASLRIADGRFANLGPRASDLALVNTSKETTLFHLIEVQRVAD